MDQQARELLQLFLCEPNRLAEEEFAKTLSENEKTRLFFIHEDRAFTDGRNITVDPGMAEAFADTQALEQAEAFLKLPPVCSADPWNALEVITRGQTIHECLHLLYTNFPLDWLKDERNTNKTRGKVLSLISNIIEDAFIEAAGCCVFDNLAFFLQFLRLSTLFSDTKIKGTTENTFQEENDAAFGDDETESEELTQEQYKLILLQEYLNYMLCWLLYPHDFLDQPLPQIADYVEKTCRLFWEGSACGEADLRYSYTQRIFDIIEPLIPLIEDAQFSTVYRLLPGSQTHDATVTVLHPVHRKGRSCRITRRLFTDLEGNSRPGDDFSVQIGELEQIYRENREAVQEVVMQRPRVREWHGEDFDCHSIHHGISLVETRPAPNPKLKKAYQNVYDKYRLQISGYNGKFAQLLQVPVDVREEKRMFGAGISSRYLNDRKRRYWYRTVQEQGVPELSVMVLIDGSGSMWGARREAAMTASVILHEVLKKQGIAHAIVEHRAVYGESTVQHNILVDYSGKEAQKYNILELKAQSGTREGLSLYWAERYMQRNGGTGERLLVVISDGCPEHVAADGVTCCPPVSTKDAAHAARKIVKRGTKIIAVALDESEQLDGCYTQLCEIYPAVVACDDLGKLPAQLLQIISRELRG